MISTSSSGTGVRVEVTGKSLDRAERLLAGLPGGIDKAVRSAMSRATSSLRTGAVKEIRKVYALSASSIRSEQNIKTRYTYSNGAISSQVTFSGVKIPLYRYDGTSPKMPTVNKNKRVFAIINGHSVPVHPGVAARGHQRTDTSPENFENAFIAKMRSGHIGIFERTGDKMASGGDAIHELMGQSVPQMVGNDQIREELTRSAWEKFEERLDHEVDALLNGWR